MLRIMHSISLVSRGRAVVSWLSWRGRIAATGSLSRRTAICLLYFHRETHMYLSSRLLISRREETNGELGCPTENIKIKAIIFAIFLHPSYFFLHVYYICKHNFGEETEIDTNFTRPKFLKTAKRRMNRTDSSVEEESTRAESAFLHSMYAEGVSNRPENPVFLGIKPVRMGKKEERTRNLSSRSLPESHNRNRTIYIDINSYSAG